MRALRAGGFIADHTGLNPETGRPSRVARPRLRLDEAKRLLRDGTKSIAEISYSLGYCNPAYFTNTFRAATGQTPKSWRTGN